MENLLVISKEKKLNIFQKIRLNIFKKNIYKPNFDIVKYENAPAYIKRDEIVIRNLISVIKDKMDYLEEKNAEKEQSLLLKIPEDKLFECIQNSELELFDLPLDTQLKFVKRDKYILRLRNEKIKFVNQAMEKGKYEFLGEYPEIQESIIQNMQKLEVLDEKLPKIVDYLENPIPYIKENPNLIKNLSEEKQIKLFYNNKEYLKYISEDIQLNYIREHNEYAKYASDKVAEEFIKLNKENLNKTNLEFQLKVVQKYPNSYKYISREAEKEIWSNGRNEEAVKAALELLKKDIRYSKKFAEYKFDAIEKTGEHLGGKEQNKYYSELMEYLKNANLEDTRKFFLHSKLLGTKGKILKSNIVMHGMIDSELVIPGIEDYSEEQKKIVQNLKLEQIKELINVDSNYILPYLMNDEKNLALTTKGRELSQKKCRELFAKIYGEEKLTKLDECINIIYNRSNIERRYENTNRIDKKLYEERLKIENVFINEFKILFNKNIIENSSIDEIKEYFAKVEKDEDSQKEFYKLIKNAYGTKAVEILEARPELNVHTINSLEVFDERIINNFGEAFVHDLISYNIRDNQEFLDIIKNEEKLETFKTYYETLTKIMGNNVETMQRAISEYNYFDELLQNVKNIELTEEQYGNLASVLCSRDNQFEINTIEDLQNYNEISNKLIERKLEETVKLKNKSIEKAHEYANAKYEEAKIDQNWKENISRIICGDILGLRIDDPAIRDYNDDLYDITELYDISLENKENYSKEENEMMECLKFIKNEKDSNKLMILAQNLLKEKDIKNPVIMHKTVEKLKENQTELFNKSLLTVEKMEKLCEEEKNNENPKITKEITEDGLVKYILKGVDFKITMHDSHGILLEKLIKGEMQIGNPYICARLITNKNIILDIDGMHFYCYSSIKSPGGIVAYNGIDANTDHLSKRTRGEGGKKEKIMNFAPIEQGKINEIAQFRRHRKHEEISNKNRGGKFLPDFIVNPSEEDIKVMKEYNIPILEIDSEVYKKLAEQKEQKKIKEKSKSKDEGR